MAISSKVIGLNTIFEDKTMDATANRDGFFPDESAIPSEVKLPGFLEQREFLLDGQLLHWSGDVNPVLSPVCTTQNGRHTVVQLANRQLITN